MKIAVITLILSLFTGSLAFQSVRPLPPNIIDTSFLKTATNKKKTSFSQLTTLMQQFRDSSQVTEFLNQHLAHLEEARLEKLAIIQSDRAAFTEESAVRTQAVSEGQASAAASQAQLTACTNQRAIAVDRQERATKSLARFAEKLQRLIDNRAAQHKLNLRQIDSLEDFQEKVTTLNQLLDDYEAGSISPATDGAFIQITNKLLKGALKNGQSQLITSVYNKLIQMHSKQEVDEESLSEIRQLLTKMSDLAQQHAQEINDQDAEQQIQFEKNQEAIKSVVDVLTSQVAQTSEFIDSADQCIAQESSILELSNDKVDRNSSLLEIAIELSKAVEAQWTLSEQSRRREFSLINALLSAVKRFEQAFEAEVSERPGDLVNLKMI